MAKCSAAIPAAVVAASPTGEGKMPSRQPARCRRYQDVNLSVKTGIAYGARTCLSFARLQYRRPGKKFECRHRPIACFRRSRGGLIFLRNRAGGVPRAGLVSELCGRAGYRENPATAARRPSRRRATVRATTRTRKGSSHHRPRHSVVWQLDHRRSRPDNPSPSHARAPLCIGTIGRDRTGRASSSAPTNNSRTTRCLTARARGAQGKLANSNETNTDKNFFLFSLHFVRVDPCRSVADLDFTE